MEKTESPLKKYRRQPKLYFNIPSIGKWYNENAFAENTYTDLAVYSMTASDEILFKTPDALINGEATAKNINSCIPSILDPWKIKTLDLDAILIAIRMASYGETMNVTAKCKKCGADNQYEIELQKYLDFFSSKEFEDKVYYENFVIHIEPLSYKQWTNIQKQQTAYQRALNLTVSKIVEENEKEKFIQDVIDKINVLVAQAILDQVVAVEVDGQVETNRKEIDDFLEQAEVGLFHELKKVIEANTTEWRIPPESIKCNECEHEDSVRISLDASDFFVQG